MRLKSAGLAAALALVVASCGGGAPQADSAADEIGVRGAWTIDVYNADGSHEAQVEFSNAFTGNDILADVLAMTESVSGWNIQAAPGGGPQICDTGSGGCSFSASASRDSSTDELVLEGSFTPEFDGTVTQVFANIVAASNGGNVTFSSKDLGLEGPGLVDVNAGQTVQVEVRYSFGTLP